MFYKDPNTQCTALLELRSSQLDNCLNTADFWSKTCRIHYLKSIDDYMRGIFRLSNYK